MSPDGTYIGVAVTTGTAVTTLGSGVPSPLAGYPPASTATLNTPGNLYLNVTGTVAPALGPVPSSLLLALAGLVGIGLWFARRKFAAA
jgi:hypothetical protein